MGGLQISVIPLKKEVWSARRAAWERRRASLQERADILPEMACMSMEMGLAPGGRMHQAIEPDPFELDDWDTAAADRVFVTLVHGKDWKAITGEPAHEHPPNARTYTEAGLPWFSYYGADQMALPGSGTLGGLTSAGAMHEALTGASLPDSEDVEVKVVVPTTPTNRSRPIAIGSWDE